MRKVPGVCSGKRIPPAPVSSPKAARDLRDDDLEFSEPPFQGYFYFIDEESWIDISDFPKATQLNSGRTQMSQEVCPVHKPGLFSPSPGAAGGQRV